MIDPKDETPYQRNVRFYPLTHCRCGAEVERDFMGIPFCPNEEKPGELRVYHDVCLQNMKSEIFWKIVREDGLFRPYGGGDRCPEAFATERLAWEELERAYEGRTEWASYEA
jgi:hypothetical protein